MSIKLLNILLEGDLELSYPKSVRKAADVRTPKDAITIALGDYLDSIVRKDLTEQKSDIEIDLVKIIKNFTNAIDDSQTNRAVIKRIITQITKGFAELPDKAKIETNDGVYNLEKNGNKLKITLAPGDKDFKVFDPLGDFIKQAGGGDTGLNKIIGANESLRNWFKKEKWKRIDTQGNIAGDCGTMPKGKATQRCLPAAKARSLTKKQRAATSRKKVRGSKKGKQFVKNTKKAKVKLKK